MTDAVIWVIALPLAGALLTVLSPRHVDAVGVATALGTATAALALLWQVAAGGPVRYAVGGWTPGLGIALHADGLAVALLVMTALVALAAGAYATAYFRQGLGRRRFWPLWLLLWTALNALFLAGDLFNIYVTLELLGLAAVGLTALGGKRAALEAALRYLVAGLVGSMAYLAGVVLIYTAYGTLDLAAVAAAIRPEPAAWTALALMTAGLLLKTALFPLHFWLPPAHANAPAPVSAALSALVVKAAFYLVLRLWLDLFAPVVTSAAANLLGLLGAAAVLWGSWQALRAERLKLVAAYSTVAQIGYLFLFFPLLAGLPDGSVRDAVFGGAVLLALTHGFAKGALFLAAGVVQQRAGHDRIRDLDGTAQGFPAATFAIALAGVALIGLPPSGAFIGKWQLISGAIATGQWFWVPVVLAGSLLAAAYIFRVLGHAFGDRPSQDRRMTLAREEVPALALATLATVILGLGAAPLWTLLGATGLLDGRALGFDAWLPGLIVLSSWVPGVFIFVLQEDSHRLRTALNLFGAVTKLVLVGVMIWGVFHGHVYETRWTLGPGLELVLHADALSVLFVTLSTVLWLVTTVYAIGYLEESPRRSRFFGFFSLCVTATVGLALAGNLLTFVIFYEALTLATYPLVAHRGTPEAIRGARIYLTYTLGGGALVLLGAIWLGTLAGPLEFVQGGILGNLPAELHGQFRWIFLVLIIGLGVKAALVPLHGWLPHAMVAPAPVSALLHAVAVVKAGAFGIVRVVYDVYGVEFADRLGLLTGLAVAAAVTILYGSLRALMQDNLKKRLAYSTVSQVSYIALGTAILGPIASIGGVVHLVHQGLMKITLFFAAGNYAETLGVHKVSEMDGVGRRMPGTTFAFTIGALGMIGVPPIAGFVTKWYLGLGAVAAGQAAWVLPVLIASSLLNAAYFLPVLYRAWFREPAGDWPEEHIPAGRRETAGALLWPPVVTAALALAAGLFAAAPYSPLEWAELIARREYGL